MGIDSDAEKDLALSDEDADGVVGGHKAKKAKAAHHTSGHTAAATTAPEMIYQPAPAIVPAASPAPSQPSSPSGASSPSAPASPTSDC